MVCVNGGFWFINRDKNVMVFYDGWFKCGEWQFGGAYGGSEVQGLRSIDRVGNWGGSRCALVAGPLCGAYALALVAHVSFLGLL